MNLTGKVVMIVGAGRGIGRSCAELFSKAGANLALAAAQRVRGGAAAWSLPPLAAHPPVLPRR